MLRGSMAFSLNSVLGLKDILSFYSFEIIH
jgi:hypothetical protein